MEPKFIENPKLSEDAACSPDKLPDNLVTAMNQPGPTRDDHRAYTMQEVREFVETFSETDLADVFFPSSKERRRDIETVKMAKRVCALCAVKNECAEWGMNEAHGVWGGLSEAERDSLKRRFRRLPTKDDEAA